MALKELDPYEEDYVFLSDIDSEPDFATPFSSSRATLRHPSARSSAKQVSFGLIQGGSSSAHPQQHQQQHRQFNLNQRQENHESTQEGEERHDNNSDFDDDDLEEIEYAFETDTLIIMPAMLQNYSHHATNYHPELWKAPIPGSSSSSQAALARSRHEEKKDSTDRMLDRAELLKTTIPPTTCGICFESFTPFDLDQQQQVNTPATEFSSRAHFVMSFAARLARSFAAIDSTNTTIGQSHGSSSSSTAIDIPGSPVLSAVGDPAHSTFCSAASRTSMNRRSIAPSITPSVSSRDIGIIMPCNHGLCLSCLQSFLTNAIGNTQSRFPTLCPQPGCRTPIPTESAELVLDATTLEVWYRKLAEIHVANKVCCPQPECRSVIDLDDRDGTAVTCPECKSSFCATCAVPFHRGMTCEQYQAQAQGGDSEEDRAMLRLVKDRRWRHCPSCRFVIEKQQGCHHMVCHCGQSFCYACGSPWNELDARCSRNCEIEGTEEDTGLDCVIM